MTKIWGLSKRDAEYGPAPTPDVRCDNCKYMFPPLALGGCRLVRGVISGSSSCKEFVHGVQRTPVHQGKRGNV